LANLRVMRDRWAALCRIVPTTCCRVEPTISDVTVGFGEGASLLLDYPDLDLRLDVGVESDGHAVHAERLDWLAQSDLALLDHVEALSMKLVGDIGRRDRTEELALLTNACGKGERDGLEAS